MDCIFTADKSEDTLLINSQVFSKEELRNILLMRKQYETKIRRKEKPAFFAYVEKEKKILEKVQSFSKNDDELSNQIILRIIRLHKIALSFFKDDLKIWLSFIKFCTEIGNIHLVTESLSLMLQDHTEKRLWHLAAKWELTQFNNRDKALNYLYRGLNFNPSAPCLYTHIFKLELSIINNSSKENSCNELEISEAQKNAELKAIKLFEMTMKAHLELDLYMDLLKIASEYKYTNKLQSKICIYLIEKYSKNETVWNMLAQRELEGHHLTDENSYTFVINLDDRVKFCIKKYQRAIEYINNETMWVKYLNSLVDLYERSNTNSFIKENFMSACEIAHKECYMTEKHYMVWLECLNNSVDVAEILKFATKNKPHYIQLWVARVRYHFTKKEESEVELIFEQAIKSLGDDSIQIWRRKLQYYQLKCDNHNKIETIFREGLEFSDKISFALQPQFLEWVALFRSRDIVHKIYKELSERKPICVDLHKKMAELEAMCSKPSEDIFQAINNIMNENPDQKEEWKEYIYQELHYGPNWRREIYKKYLSCG